MKKILIRLGLGMLVVMALALGLATPASAAQQGLQRIHVESDSWSGVYTRFACGNSYTVPVGATWGEGQAYPQCGSVGSASEPHSAYVGPGWCVTLWRTGDNGRDIGYRWYLEGGGSGGWFQLWDDNFDELTPNGYTEHVESWYGSWCPTYGSPNTVTVSA